MKAVKRGVEWWITNTPEGEDFGPYDSKDEANEGIRGLERFYNVEINRRVKKEH